MHAAAVRNVSRPKSRMDELDDDVLWAIIVYRAGAWRCLCAACAAFSIGSCTTTRGGCSTCLPRDSMSCSLRVQRDSDRARRSMASRELVCDRGNNDIGLCAVLGIMVFITNGEAVGRA